VENLTVKARGTISPRTVLRHHHPAREAEAEAEGQTLARAPLRAGGV
jgi:hypothetical protein